MATWRDRYWESGGKIRRGYIVTFVNESGKRQTATFTDAKTAEYFCAEVAKKEALWRDRRRAAKMLASLGAN